MATKFRPGDGDWTCPDASCGNVNFARRNACNRCGKPKEDEKAKVKKLGMEIGKDAAEKSKGLFSADDWMCTKCGNVNWARRSTCNVCNAPRFGEVEERTGYGGGYNERGTVEYKERVESDDEFDEFGRIKKKFRKNDNVTDAPSTSSNAPPVDEEDDDEEDDDDGDLSKYDLSGWGDESNEKTEEKKAVETPKTESSSKTSRTHHSDKSNSPSRSRSSSRSGSRSRSKRSSDNRKDRRRRRSRSSSDSSRSRSRSRFGLPMKGSY